MRSALVSIAFDAPAAAGRAQQQRVFKLLHLRCLRRLRHIQHGAACVKLFSCATAMEERIYIASVYAPRALRTLARLAQMSGFVQPTPESFNPPKLRIDMMMSTMAAAY